MSLFGHKLAIALREQREQEQNLDALAASRPITLVGRLTSVACETISYRHGSRDEQRVVAGIVALLGDQAATGCRLRVTCTLAGEVGTHFVAQEAVIIGD